MSHQLCAVRVRSGFEKPVYQSPFGGRKFKSIYFGYRFDCVPVRMLKRNSDPKQMRFSKVSIISLVSQVDVVPQGLMVTDFDGRRYSTEEELRNALQVPTSMRKPHFDHPRKKALPGIKPRLYALTSFCYPGYKGEQRRPATTTLLYEIMTVDS